MNLGGDLLVLLMNNLRISTYVPPHLPKQIMRQFGHIQSIPRDHIVIAPVIIFHIDVNGIFAEYYEHLVLEDVRRVSTPRPWSMVYNYIQLI